MLASRALRSAVVLLSVLVTSSAADDRSQKGQQAGGETKEPQSKWQKLFDGKRLGKWAVIDEFDFKRHGKVRVADGRIVMEKGSPATGVRWTGQFPKTDYELTLQGMRVDGKDFFASMTFPTPGGPLTLVVGGWSGEIVGLSSIDDEPAVENDTCRYVEFEKNRWYRIRLKVTEPKIEAWIDDQQVVDFSPKHRELSLYWEMEPMLPFGIATWETTGAVRDIRLRKIAAAVVEKK